MLALAWLFSIVGFIVSYIISLAGAMRTVPRLYGHEAVQGVPLPLVAGLLAGWCLLRPQPPAERPWISAGIPLALAILALLIVAVSYFDQPA